MKKRMFVTAALLASAGATGARPGQALHITGEGHTSFNGMAFVGEAVLQIEGVEFTADITTVPLGMWPLPNGNIRAVTSHTFDFGGGDTFQTRDHVILVPTETPGLYELHSHLTVTGGTGIYEGATGRLGGPLEATINFITGNADWLTEGTITLRP